jgi:serine/threonine protein kinase
MMLDADFPMDMWSIACTIYELFTAEILFKGRNNNEMLKLIMNLKGPIPKRMIKKGMFSSQHFAGVCHPQILHSARFLGSPLHLPALCLIACMPQTCPATESSLT